MNTYTMNTRKTYILFCTTGQNVSRGGRLRKAHAVEYMTCEEASRKLMSHCFEEDDNYVYSDDGNRILFSGETVMTEGEMAYEHDSRVWEFLALDELDENDYAIAILDNRLSEAELEEAYALHPDLNPDGDEG